MFKLFYKMQAEKIFFSLVIISTLLPTFGAIDNNSIRWLFISLIYNKTIIK